MSKTETLDLDVIKQKIVATVDASQDEALLQDILAVLTKQDRSVDDTDLTPLCLVSSEKSLSEAWDNEDDDRWNSFLKN